MADVADVKWKKSIELSKGEALWKSMEVHDWKYLVAQPVASENSCMILRVRVYEYESTSISLRV